MCAFNYLRERTGDSYRFFRALFWMFFFFLRNSIRFNHLIFHLNLQHLCEHFESERNAFFNQLSCKTTQCSVKHNMACNSTNCLHQFSFIYSSSNWFHYTRHRNQFILSALNCGISWMKRCLKLFPASVRLVYRIEWPMKNSEAEKYRCVDCNCNANELIFI